MTKRNQLVPGVLGVLLFVCGVAAGALGQRYYSSTAVNVSDLWRKNYVNEMHSKLALNGAQMDLLEKILDDTKAKYKAVRDEYRPAMLAVKEEQIRRVKAILTATQVAVYEQLLAEREQKAKEQEEHEHEKERKESAAHTAKAAGR